MPKFAVGIFLLVLIAAIGVWPSMAPALSVANTTFIQLKGNLVKSRTWASEVGYQLAARLPVCDRIRNAPFGYYGDPFCKAHDFYVLHRQ